MSLPRLRLPIVHKKVGMENSFKTSEPFRKDFVLTGQNFIIGITFLEYCKHKNTVTPGFTDHRHRAMAYFFSSLVSLPELSYKDLISIIKNGIDPFVFKTISKELRRLRLHTLNEVMNINQRLGDYLQEVTRVQPSAICRVSMVGRFLRKLHLTLNVADFNHLVRFSKYLTRYFDGETGIESRDESSLRGLSSSMRDISIEGDPPNGPGAPAAPWPMWGKARAIAYLNQQARRFRDCPGLTTKPKQLQKDLEEILAEDPEFTDVHYISYLNLMLFGEYSGAMETCHKFFLSSKKSSAVKFRFALLNLAMLHRRFYHFKEAELALKECINLCQQAGDTETLKKASSWLEGLQPVNCRPESGSRPKDSSHRLYPARYINQLEHLPLTEDTLSESFERLYRKWADGETGPGSLLARNTEEALLWMRYGFYQFAQLHCEMILHLCQVKVSHHQEERVLMKESTILALALLARNAVSNYRDSEAIQFMQTAAAMIPQHGELADMVDVSAHNVACERALRREHYGLLGDLIDSMSLTSPVMAQVFRARMHFQQGDHSAALRILEDCDSQPGGNPFYIARGLLKSRILLEAGSDQVLNCILKYLAECERFHLVFLGAMLKLELVRYQGRIGCSFSVTVPTLRIVGPIILSQGMHEDRLHFRLAMTELSQNAYRSIARMTTVYEEWRLTRDVYNQRRALDFLARKAHELGDRERRNIYCNLFKKLVTTQHE